MTPLAGVLALQGGVSEHIAMLTCLKCRTRQIRLPGDLKDIQALIIPGGESTALIRLIKRWDLTEPISDIAQNGTPVWGTCAGSILISGSVTERDHLVQQETLGLAPVRAERNSFGRQVASFQEDLSIKGIPEPFPGVFIRAPLLTPLDPEVEVLCRVKEGPVFLRYRNIWLSSFHPELTDNTGVHALFLKESGLGSET
jgi:5'-phosphate synthase pdxT subunit